MFLEIGLVLGLNVLTAVSAAAPEARSLFPSSLPPVEILREALVKPEGPRWAPNRMKILHFNRRGRWVVRLSPPQVEKNVYLPIEQVEP